LTASATCGTCGNAAPLGHNIQIFPLLLHVAGQLPSRFTGAPEQVGAHFAGNCASGVLRATGRTKGVPSGLVVDNHNRLPSGITLRSTAAL
jgi:hypothetical protein